jgi:2-keto-3-deoxy-6-phosphogluconate aldolase
MLTALAGVLPAARDVPQGAVSLSTKTDWLNLLSATVICNGMQTA